MCWIGENKPKIANKDIKVFKVGFMLNNGSLLSAYTEFRYNLNEKYETILGVKTFVNHVYAFIEEGFHSYNSKKCEILPDEENDDDVVEVTINCGKEELDTWGIIKNRPISLVRMDCTIPKGSVYYENHKGEIVSNAIVINTSKKII